MPKLIKTTDELPQEFNLDNYKDLDKKSAVFWHHAIHTRLMLNYYLNYDYEDFSNALGFGSGPDQDPPLTHTEIDDIKKIAIKNILENPMMTNLKFDFCRKNGRLNEIDIYDDNYTGYFKNHLPVSEFTMHKVKMLTYIISNYIKPQTIEDAEKDLPLQEFLYQNMNFYLYKTEYPICINPFYPDNVIFNELKKKLDEIRQIIKIENKKPVERKDLIAWAAYGLIPFFDLKLWESFNGCKITRSVMAVTLYPKGQYGEDTIRKSVEPLYSEIINGDIFDGGGFEDINMAKSLPLMDSLTRLAYSESGKEFA